MALLATAITPSSAYTGFASVSSESEEEDEEPYDSSELEFDYSMLAALLTPPATAARKPRKRVALDHYKRRKVKVKGTRALRRRYCEGLWPSICYKFEAEAGGRKSGWGGQAQFTI
ncbi:hypothetical protein GGX14DRAFT_561007 [Mycena pura]|uniref:Uncharacterized protein n=1 Tax=Mycena pura TaxID=153505 RepID=A0AAD6VQ30_9AGAR|nr:hypothetical protein GGX14DRAFT_561007 [Mycena pura]